MRLDQYPTPTDPSVDRERLARQEQYQEWWDAASQYPDEVITDPSTVPDRPSPRRPWWQKVRDFIRDHRGEGGLHVAEDHQSFTEGLDNVRQIAGDVLGAEKTVGRMAAETTQGHGPLVHGFWNFVGSGAEAVQALGAKGAEMAGLITPEQRARFEDKLEEERAVMRALNDEVAPLHGTADEIVSGLTQVALGVVVAKRIIPGEGLLGFAGQGAIVDFFGFDPEDSPIFDDIGNWLGKHSPLGASALQAALVVNADDTEVEERLKRTLGGGLSGLSIDLLTRVARVFRMGLRLKNEIGALGHPDEIGKLRDAIEAEVSELEGVAKGEIPPEGSHVYAKEDGTLGFSGLLTPLENPVAADSKVTFRSATRPRLTDVEVRSIRNDGANIAEGLEHAWKASGGDVLSSEEAWHRGMSALDEPLGKALQKQVPVAPGVALAWAENPRLLAERLASISSDMVEAASDGLARAQVLGKLWQLGKVQDTGMLMSWALLSSNSTPFRHEGGFLQAMPALEKAWTELAQTGKVSKETLKLVKAVPGESTSALSPARGVTHNFGRLAKFLEWGSKNNNFIRLDEALRTAKSGREFRRKFWEVVGKDKIGFDNKLISFMALSLGFDDVIVLDTQMIQQLWGAPAGSVKRLMSDGFGGALGAARYEMLEDGLSGPVQLAYEAVQRQTLMPGETNLARFHWETWLHQSGQVTDHPSLKALVKSFSGIPSELATEGVEIPVGKLSSWTAGMKFSAEEGGTMVWTSQRGSTFKMTLESAEKAINAIAEAASDPTLSMQLDWLFPASMVAGENGFLKMQVPSAFNAAEEFARTGVPFYENPKVNRRALDRVFEVASRPGLEFDRDELIQAGLDYAQSVKVAGERRAARVGTTARRELAKSVTEAHNASVGTDNIGSTFSLRHGSVSDADAWAVGVYPERQMIVPGKELDEKSVQEFVEQNKALLRDDRLAVGSWYDAKNDQSVLDVVALVRDQTHATMLGSRYNQQSIFHLGTKETRELGGDGQVATWLQKHGIGMRSVEAWEKLSVNKRLIDTPSAGRGRMASLDILSKPFKRWFKKSVVLNDVGEPLVVYHGSPNSFDEFSKTKDLGFHFGTEQQARARLKNMSVSSLGRLEGYHLSLQNPWVTHDHGGWHPIEVLQSMLEDKVLTPKRASRILDEFFADGEADEEFEKMLAAFLRGGDDRSGVLFDLKSQFDYWHPDLGPEGYEPLKEALKDAGFDGVKYKNSWEAPGNSFIVLDAEQIKHATKNSGDYGIKEAKFLFDGAAGGIAGGLIAQQQQDNETVDLRQLQDSIDAYRQEAGMPQSEDSKKALGIFGGIAAGALGAYGLSRLLRRTAPKFASRAVAETEAHGLNSMIDASTHPNVAGKLSREQTDQVFSLAKKMQSGEVSVQQIAKLLVDTKWNISYMTAPEQVRAVHSAMVDTFREAFDAIRRQPEGKKVAESFREAIIEMDGLNVDQAKVVFPDLVSRTQDLDVELLVANMVLRDMGQQLAGFAKQIDQSPGTRRAILDRARPLLEAYLDSSLAYSGAKSEVGRALNILKYVKARGEVGHAVTGAVVGGLAAPDVLEGQDGEQPSPGKKIAQHAIGAAVGAAAGIGASRLIRGARQAVRGSSISLAKGSQQLTAGMNQRDIEKVLRLFDLSDGSPRDVVAISKAIEAKVGKGGGWSKAQEVFYNSILSAPVTWGTVTSSGVALTAFEAASRIAGGALRLSYTGDAALLREGLDMTAAHFRYFEESFVAGWKALKEGRSILDPSPIPGAIGGKLGSVIRTPSRLMTALDEATTTANYRAYVRAKALRSAREAAAARGLKGAQATDYIMSRAEEDVASAFDKDSHIALIPEALEFARIPAGTAALDPASFSGRFQKFAASTPLLKFIVPFVRAPSNLMRYAFMDSSPLGLMSPRIRQAIRAGGEQRDVTLARMALGTSLLGAAGAWAASGKITGNGPNDPKLRELWLKDHQPYSINLGGTWYSYRRLEPFGSLMGATADASQAYAEYARDAQESDANALDGVFAALLSGFVENFTNKSYAAGLNMFFDAMSGDVHSASRWLTNFGTAFAIPRGVQAAGEMVTNDPYSRQARTSLTRFLDKVPGWSPRLPLRYNIFGEGQQRSSVGESRAEALWHPLASRPVTESVESKLATLPKGFSLPGPIKRVLGHRIDLNDPGWKSTTGRDITPYARWMELIRDGVEGQGTLRSAVEEYVNGPEWDEATAKSETYFTSDPRWEKVNEILQERYAQAELVMLSEFPDLAQAKSYGGILSQLEGQDITNSYIKEALDKLKPPTKRGK